MEKRPKSSWGKPESPPELGSRGIVAEAGVPPGANLRRPVVAAAEVAPAVALDQVLAEHEQPRLVGLPGVDVLEQVVALDVLDGVDPQRVDAHVEIAVDAADDVVLDVLALGGEIDAVAGQVLVLQRMGALPVAAADESLLVVPLGVEAVGVDAEEAAGIVAGLGQPSRRSWDRPGARCLRGSRAWRSRYQSGATGLSMSSRFGQA